MADEPQIMAQMKLVQPFTSQPIINCLSVHQDEFCILEPHLRKLLCRVFAHMLGVNLKYQVENNWVFFREPDKICVLFDFEFVGLQRVCAGAAFTHPSNGISPHSNANML